jgi:hypothetical protein
MMKTSSTVGELWQALEGGITLEVAGVQMDGQAFIQHLIEIGARLQNLTPRAVSGIEYIYERPCGDLRRRKIQSLPRPWCNFLRFAFQQESISYAVEIARDGTKGNVGTAMQDSLF